MPDINGALSVIANITGNIWTLWTLSITVNVAILGWLIQRHGLYELSEKILSTAGYTSFVIVIMYGMHVTHKQLDLAANDLAFIYTEEVKKQNNMRLISTKGLIATYISRSPAYCNKLKENLCINKCTRYSDKVKVKVKVNWSIIFCGWLINVVFFWYESFWEKARKFETTLENQN
ncbi:MAG: hypothetical protein V7782_11050 [Psychromonas sp.]